MSHPAHGWCFECAVEHHLGNGEAREHAAVLMRELESRRNLCAPGNPGGADPRFFTDYLFGPALGQMFGVLECRDPRGKTVVLRAFSCQYNGAWNIAGWAPPLFDTAAYDRIMVPADREIKKLGLEIDRALLSKPEIDARRRSRKNLSRQIMKELHRLYTVRNFRGETAALSVFFGTRGVPSGAGDCCAPKLLNQAVRRGLHPVGIAEFYWGAVNASGTRQHGRFYSCCAARCQPILGFMLCGVTP